MKRFEPAGDPVAAIAQVTKDLGLDDDVLIHGKERRNRKTLRTSTGILALDAALGGGLPLNQWTEIVGHESCLAPETFIRYQVRRPDGTLQSHKGGSIQRLYERFHGHRRDYRYDLVKDSEYWAPSVNDEGRVVINRVLDVVHTGKKPVFRVETKRGHVIRATAEHRFLVGPKFVPLADLRVGDTVFIHNNTRYRAGESSPVEDRKYRKMLFVKHHGVAGVKEVFDKKTGNTYQYHRLAQYRAVMEAHLNGLDFDTYVARLNAGDLDGLEFLSRDVHVHHLDEDFTNDRLENLVLISPQEHGREHATVRHNNLRYVAVEDEVLSIVEDGVEDTYDLKMASPYHNFVADSFVVHNSGKTALAHKIIAHHQARDPSWVCAWVAAEELEEDYAEALGVDLDRIVLIDTNATEMAFDAMTELAKRRAVDGFVIDSLPALVPAGEYEGSMEDQQMALQARLNGKFFRRWYGAGNRSLIHEDRPWLGLVINQWRSRVGFFMGDPRVTPGGQAKDYAYYVKLDVRRDEFLDNGTPKKDPTHKKVGQTIVIRVRKNKIGPPERQASFDFYFDDFEDYQLGDIDRVKDVFNTASMLGIVERDGNSYYFDGDKFGGNKPAALRRLEGDDDLLDAIADEVTAHFARRVALDQEKRDQPRRVKRG